MMEAPSTLSARGLAHANGDAARPRARSVEAGEASIATGDVLDVRRFHVTERMSGLFEARIVGVSDNPDIDFESAIGQSTSVVLRGARGERSLSGVCAHLQQIAVEERNLSTYELTLVPSLWLATQRRNHRMFQLMSEVDIVQKILGEWGVAFSLKLGGSYKKRKIRVQYGESDYDFLSRMLEDAGVSFYFDGGVMVLDDGPHQNSPRAPIAFRDHPTETDREHVTGVRVGRRVRPGKVTVRDHDHRRPPTYPLLQSAGGGGVEARLERFEYAPGAFVYESDKGDPTPIADDKGKYRADEGEGKKLAERKLAAQRGSAREVSFLTNVLDLTPGGVLSFVDHPKSELGAGKSLLVTESELSGEIPGIWRHACTAVSASTPFRPPSRAEKPRVLGVESATVVGPPGEEIHVDELGRVRVHFHWDRESQMNDASSCWIHVSQPWGGAGFGGTNIPRVGQEVIVDFLGADPDRPIIVGRVYTSLQKTPYKLPDNKTQSGWKSNSTGGGGGYNELMFEDSAGRELVRMQAERDLEKRVKHDEKVTIDNDRQKLVGRDDRLAVARDRAKEVGNDESTAIGHDRAETVGNDASIAVGHDRATSVGHDEELIVGNDATKNVQANLRENVGMNRARAVGASETVQIGADQRIAVADAQDVEVGGSQSVSVGGSQKVSVRKTSTESVMLAKTLSVGGAYQISVGAAMNTSVLAMSTEEVGFHKTIKVGHKLEIVCGKSKITMESSGKVTIEGTEISIKSEGPVDVEGKKAITVKGSETVAITADKQAELHGASVQITGDPIDLN